MLHARPLLILWPPGCQNTTPTPHTHTHTRTHTVSSDLHWETDTQNITGQVPEPEWIGCEGKTGSVQGVEVSIAARWSKESGGGIQE